MSNYKSGLKGVKQNVAKRLLVANLTQAAAVQNTWYTILDTTYHIDVYQLAIRMATAGETLEVRITLNGVAITSVGFAAVADTSYWMSFKADPTSSTISLINGSAGQTYLMQGFYAPQPCRSVKIEIRKTTAAGANTLYGTVVYGQD